MPYISPNVITKEKRTSKVGVTAASVVAAGTLLASHPGTNAFAKEQVEATKIEILSEVVKSPIIERVAPAIQEKVVASQPKVVEKIAQEVIHSETKEHKVTLPKSVEKIVLEKAAERKETVSQIQPKEEGKVEAKIETKIEAKKEAKEPAIQAAESEPVAFNPDEVYGKEFIKHGKPLLASLTASQETALKNSMIRPLPRSSYGQISSAFEPRNLVEGEDFHHGVDYPSPIGTPVYAAADGKVIYAGKAGGYGGWIVLEHVLNEKTFYTIYGHMKPESSLVNEGDTVKQGTQISLVDSQGTSTGPHLHFSIAASRNPDSPRHFYEYINPTFAVDMEKSDTYAYEGFSSPIVEETSSFAEEDYWHFAQKAAEQTGWDPILIFSQWQHETKHFTSNVFRKNNNIAGQTWNANMPESIKGTPRPAIEGGYYIKYADPVVGYVDFILNNPRYQHVKEKATAEEQAIELKRAGWAVDELYAEKLIAKIAENREKFGIVKPAEAPKDEKIVETAETETETETVEAVEEEKETTTTEEKASDEQAEEQTASEETDEDGISFVSKEKASKKKEDKKEEQKEDKEEDGFSFISKFFKDDQKTDE